MTGDLHKRIKIPISSSESLQQTTVTISVSRWRMSIIGAVDESKQRTISVKNGFSGDIQWITNDEHHIYKIAAALEWNVKAIYPVVLP